MAQGRIILASLGSSRKFAALSGICRTMPEFAQSLFPLLVANSDEHGRLSGDAFTVKNRVFPTSPRTEDEFDVALDALHTAGLITRYRVDGEVYIQVVKFEAGQPGLRLDRRRKRSIYPEPPETGTKTTSRRTTPATAGECQTPPLEEKRREEKQEDGADAPACLPADIWETWRGEVENCLHDLLPLTPRQADYDYCRQIEAKDRPMPWVRLVMRAFLLAKHKDIAAKPRTIGYLLHWWSWLENKLAENGHSPQQEAA